MENITIRPIKEEDYNFINKWWKGVGNSPPPRQLLPENGLHGLIVCKEKIPIACTYLYLTNSKMGYCDYMIGDPEYREKDRFNLIFKLMAAAIETAKNLGYEDFWFITKSEGLVEKCKDLGVKVSEDKFHLVLPLRTNRLHCSGTNL